MGEGGPVVCGREGGGEGGGKRGGARWSMWGGGGGGRYVRRCSVHPGPSPPTRTRTTTPPARVLKAISHRAYEPLNPDPTHPTCRGT